MCYNHIVECLQGTPERHLREAHNNMVLNVVCLIFPIGPLFLDLFIPGKAKHKTCPKIANVHH